MYRCPKCHAPLTVHNQSYYCENHHCYDIAKQGYVNLSLQQKKATGDNQAMIQARSEFLKHGYYERLKQYLIDQLKQYPAQVIIDAGCGQGYYTNAFAKALPNASLYGFDLSKAALKAAAGKAENAHYALASIADLPLCDACSDLAVSLFAPLYEEELARILKQNGILIKVGPGPYHLWELKQILYDNVYENKHPNPLSLFTLEKEELLTYEADITNQQHIQALLMMTPYAYRTAKAAIQRLSEQKQLHTRLQFYIQIWRK